MADYRGYVGPPDAYDIVGAMQFNMLVFYGLREYHYLLDLGCGSLRVGRLLIPYLSKGRYYGIEPNAWLVNEAIEKEIGNDLVKIKQPTFSDEKNFNLGVFNRKFDFIMAQSIFSHCSKALIVKCLKEAAKVMGENSIFLADFNEGEEDFVGEGWIYPDATRYRVPSIEGMIREAGLSFKRFERFHPIGRSTWFAIVLPGGEAALPDPGGKGSMMELKVALGLHERRVKELESKFYVRIPMWFSRLVSEL